MTTRIGIAGIAGRMGRLLAEEIVAAGAVLSGGTLRPGASLATLPPGLPVMTDIVALCAASDVVIDFTHAHAARAHALAAAETGTVLILGSSGLSATDEEAVAEAAHRTPIVYAANFAPGVNLFLAIAERMAAALPPEQYDAEIVEMHHRQKVDAPSGTAYLLGQAAAEGRGVDLAQRSVRSRDGYTGARNPGDIGFATLRGGTATGDHTVIFAGPYERIELAHKSEDRMIFARGALKAAMWARDKKPGFYTMADVLGLGAN